MNGIRVIGDEPLVLFFEAAGIRGSVAGDEKQAKELFLEAVKDSGSDIIILAARFSRFFHSEVAAANLSGEKIVFSFPDPEATTEEQGAAREIMNFLGINLQ